MAAALTFALSLRGMLIAELYKSWFLPSIFDPLKAPSALRKATLEADLTWLGRFALPEALGRYFTYKKIIRIKRSHFLYSG